MESPVFQKGVSLILVRQQTLRNALDWSYDLLSEEERRAFRRLIGTWDLGAAMTYMAIGRDGEGLDMISSLVDKGFAHSRNRKLE